MDIFATAMELAGGTSSKPLDGISLVPLLRAGADHHAGPRASASNSSSTASGSERALFHYCMEVLMAARIGDYKLKFWTEQLPADDVFTAHCPAGSPTGEFFQTWQCSGQGVTWLNPPQLYNVASDAAERWSLDYGAAPPSPAPVPARCAPDGIVQLHTGIPNVGYSPHPVVGADADAHLAVCRADCCADPHCGSVTLSTSTEGGTCKASDACCYFNPWDTTAPTAHRTNSTLAYVTRSSAVAAAAGPNPLADVVAEILAAIKAHNASLVGDVHAPVLGVGNKALQPCAKPTGSGRSAGCANYNYPDSKPKDEL